MTNNLLKGKKGLIMGVANDHSIAWGIAKEAAAQGLVAGINAARYLDGKEAVILMGAIINTGCIIGERTMIDMGVVVGGGVVIKENCHIGANAVLAGMVEPYCEQPVIIEKNSFIGAGAVVLEGVHIGENTIIGANAVVTEDIPENCVAVGIPAKVIKRNQIKNNIIENDLREI